MVRAKPAETAEKKVTSTRKAVAAKKPIQEAETEVAKEEEDVKLVEAVETAEEGVEKELEAAEEGGENAEDDGEQQKQDVDGEGVDAKVKKEKKPLTEEDIAYINEVLETKYKFSDDTETPMFSYGPAKPGVPYSRVVVCHVCRVSCLQIPINIKAHLNGKRHQENLRRENMIRTRIKQPYFLYYFREGEEVKQFKIFVGENIPEVTPEFEDRIEEKKYWDMKQVEDAELLKILSEDPIYEYNKVKPIIGLDYILKMKSIKQNNDMVYYCALCEKLPKNVYKHLTAIQHQASYIMKHFPKLYEKVVAGLKADDDHAKNISVSSIFRKLYRKIEIKHGLKVMQLVDFADFFSARLRYLGKVRRASHYGEDSLEFTEAEVKDLIRKCNDNIPFNEPDPPKLLKPGTGRLNRKRIHAAPEPEAPAIKNMRMDADEVRRWMEYEVVKDSRIERIKAQYTRFENDPKLHPSYQKEWSQFWHNRCSELKKANVNPDTYNFEEEWRPYWEKRMRKLYYMNIGKRKNNLRMNFNLPIGRRTPSPIRPRDPKNQPMSMMDAPGSMIIGAMMSASNVGPRNANNIVPTLNNQQNFVGGGGARVGGGPAQGANCDRAGASNRIAPQQQVQQQPSLSREPVSMISVLRLLTALEDQLGSLGPKSVELLGKAILCEKKKNWKALLTDEYYVLFATAKEKLKGQMMANVIDKSKVHAVEITIEDLNHIINMMDRESCNREEAGGDAAGGNNPWNAHPRDGNSYGGDDFGRNNAGGNKNSYNGGNFRNDASQNSGGGNYRSDGYRSDGGNFQNDNGNFAGNNAKYRSNADSFDGMIDGGNYRSGFNNDNANNRMGSNFDNSNYRGGNDGGMYRNQNDDGRNFNSLNTMGGGNYRSNNDDMGNFRGKNFNNESGNYRPSTGYGNFSNSSKSNFANYHGGNDLIDGNYDSTGSSFGGGSSNTGGGMGFTSNANQNRSSGGNYSNDNFMKSTSFGGRGIVGNSNTASGQRGSWMGGSGSVYSNKSNANSPAYRSGLGGFNSQQQSSTFTSSYSNRNNPPAPSFNISGGGGVGGGSNYRRYN